MNNPLKKVKCRKGRKGIDEKKGKIIGYKDREERDEKQRGSDEGEGDMHDEKRKAITRKEQSATAFQYVASLKSMSRLLPCHPFPTIQSLFSLAVHTIN